MVSIKLKALQDDLEEYAASLRARRPGDFHRLRDLEQLLKFDRDQQRLYEVDQEFLEKLRSWNVHPSEYVPDAPYSLLEEHFSRRSELRDLEFQLEQHRNLLTLVSQHLLHNPETEREVLAQRIEQFLETSELRPARWSLEYPVYAYLERLLREYVQDAEGLGAVADHSDDLPEVKELLHDLQDLIHEEHGSCGDRQAEEETGISDESIRMDIWMRIGQKLPWFWD